MKHIVIGLVASMAMGSAIAQTPPTEMAARVRADSGLVQVDAVPVTQTTSLGADVGDMVTVSNGQATVTYADECVVRVLESHQIAQESPCKAGLVPYPAAAATSGNGLLIAAGVGALVLIGASAGGGGDGPSPPPRPSSP